jgi:hypothetical protein
MERKDDAESLQDQEEGEALEKPRDDGKAERHRQRARRQQRTPAVDEQSNRLHQAGG